MKKVIGIAAAKVIGIAAALAVTTCVFFKNKQVETDETIYPSKLTFDFSSECSTEEHLYRKDSIEEKKAEKRFDIAIKYVQSKGWKPFSEETQKYLAKYRTTYQEDSDYYKMTMTCEKTGRQYKTDYFKLGEIYSCVEAQLNGDPLKRIELVWRIGYRTPKLSFEKLEDSQLAINKFGNGGNGEYVNCDLSTHKCQWHLYDRSPERYEPLDVLCNGTYKQ